MAYGPGPGGGCASWARRSFARASAPSAARTAGRTPSASSALAAGAPVELGPGLRLRVAEVPHLPPTFALRLDAGGARVCYGADCADNAELPALAAGCDLLLCECTFGADEVPPGVPAPQRARRPGRWPAGPAPERCS